ncbi:MAG: DUF1905 domain-containing protein [Saprospiraceae bacterium]|nr:DUF1905 domain-containing protein [Saprospiraceae bacterium]
MEDILHFTARLEDSNNKLWGFHLPVPQLVAHAFVAKGIKRVVCQLNEQVDFQCGLIPKGEGVYCIVVNKKLRTQLGLQPGAQVAVALRKDDSEYGLPVPEEFEEVLRQDPEGRDWFEALSPGKKRNLLYLAGQIKDPEKRISRAFILIEHLKAQQGSINFKQLNAELRAGT